MIKDRVETNWVIPEPLSSGIGHRYLSHDHMPLNCRSEVLRQHDPLSSPKITLVYKSIKEWGVSYCSRKEKSGFVALANGLLYCTGCYRYLIAFVSGYIRRNQVMNRCKWIYKKPFKNTISLDL